MWWKVEYRAANDHAWTHYGNYNSWQEACEAVTWLQRNGWEVRKTRVTR